MLNEANLSLTSAQIQVSLGFFEFRQDNNEALTKLVRNSLECHSLVEKLFTKDNQDKK